MPLFGDPAEFAIEYSLEEESARAGMLGRLCFWCGGRRIGDDELTSLRYLLYEFESWRWAKDCRTNPRFTHLTGPELLTLLDGALFFGQNFKSDKELKMWMQISEDEQWARHKISPSVDVFDNWKIYIVEGNTKARIVFCELANRDATVVSPYGEIFEIKLAVGEFDRILDLTIKELNEIDQGGRTNP